MGQSAPPATVKPRAPLVPIALAMTAGIVADRVIGVPFIAAGAMFGVGVLIWMTAANRGPRLSVIGLSLACAGQDTPLF